MTKRPLISIVTPVYQCRSCLEALADRVWTAFDGTDLDWELVLVDDRAPDEPWSLIEEMAARDPRIRGVRLARNHGQHLAIWAGLEAARGDWVAVIDCDLQDDPAVIPELYERAKRGDVEAVIVDRGEWNDTKFRRLASTVFTRSMRWLAGFNMDNRVGNFGLLL
jgi:dolichol-phosphate mannosyltransferase